MSLISEGKVYYIGVKMNKRGSAVALAKNLIDILESDGIETFSSNNLFRTESVMCWCISSNTSHDTIERKNLDYIFNADNINAVIDFIKEKEKLNDSNI